MANRTYLGFSNNLSFNKINYVSSGINNDLTPLHVILTCMNISDNKDSLYTYEDFSTSNSIFKFLLKISKEDKRLNKELSKVYSIFMKYSNYKYVITAYVELLGVADKNIILPRIEMCRHTKFNDKIIDLKFKNTKELIWKGLKILKINTMKDFYEFCSNICIVTKINELKSDPQLITGFWNT